jgi:uncharacterized protein with NAD-binding domain and iron-sulfur cluster
MKYFAILVCFYFNALTILPTVKVLKMQFAEKHQSSCTSSTSNCEPTKGCEKEKCLLNYSLNSPTFLVFNSTYVFLNNSVFIPKKEPIFYHKNFISNYIETIWQPPELFFIY